LAGVFAEVLAGRATGTQVTFPPIVTIALSCTICELFDAEIWLRCHLRLLKLVPFKSLGAVSYSPSIVTMAISVAVCEIFSVKEWCDLENRVRFDEGHWKWHRLIDRIRVPIRLP